MKRSFTQRLLIVLGLAMGVATASLAQTPVAANGQLRVLNKQLCNQAGTPVQLRGMSTHGMHWFPQCYTAGSVQTLATDWGIDVFRAVVYVDPNGYLGSYRQQLLTQVTNAVEWTAQNGVYCIIDWHTLSSGDPNAHLTEAKDFFRLMAQAHASKNHVIYEICNEPHGVSWAQIKNYADQVIPVIRQYDPDAIILCGTPNYCQQPQAVLGNEIADPNVMYTFHFYASSHTFQGDIRSVTDKLPLFASEWGTSTYTGDGSTEIRFTNGQAWLDLMAGSNPGGQKISWCNWNFADKNEYSSALVPGACAGAAWNNTSESGTWVKSKILNPADSWAGGTPTNQAPNVTLTGPTNGATYTAPATVNLMATASDADGSVSKVEFYNGATKLGEDLSAPYTFTWNNVAAGTYSLSARVTDNVGAIGTSGNVTITVNNPASTDTQAPTTPTNLVAQSVTQTGFTLSWRASTDNGGVTAYDVFANGRKVGETGSPSYVVSGLSAGTTYSLTVKARDAAGNQSAASPALNVTTQSASSPDVVIYGDALAGGWESWSWGLAAGSPNFAATSLVKVGSKSMAVTVNSDWAAVSLRSASVINPAQYPGGLRFWINGGPAGAKLQLFVHTDDQTALSTNKVLDVPANTWQQYTVGWNELGNPGSVKRLNFQDRGQRAGQTYTFYVDDLKLRPSTGARQAAPPDEPLADVTPNPSDGRCRLRWYATAPGQVGVRLTAPNGRFVTQQSHTVTTGANTLELDFGRQPTGLYLLRANQGAQTRTFKLLIQP